MHLIELRLGNNNVLRLPPSHALTEGAKGKELPEAQHCCSVRSNKADEASAEFFWSDCTPGSGAADREDQEEFEAQRQPDMHAIRSISQGSARRPSSLLMESATSNCALACGPMGPARDLPSKTSPWPNLSRIRIQSRWVFISRGRSRRTRAELASSRGLQLPTELQLPSKPLALREMRRWPPTPAITRIRRWL